MDRINVESSDIKSIGYSESAKVLEVEFLSGGIYQYACVPVSVYEDLMSASSHGKYFHQNIKGVFEFTKIR